LAHGGGRRPDLAPPPLDFARIDKSAALAIGTFRPQIKANAAALPMASNFGYGMPQAESARVKRGGKTARQGLTAGRRGDGITDGIRSS
jgi:hypothetical protein